MHHATPETGGGRKDHVHRPRPLGIRLAGNARPQVLDSGCPGDDAGPDAARTRPTLVEADRGLMTALMVSLLDLAFHAAFLVWLVTLLTYAAARLWAEIID